MLYFCCFIFNPNLHKHIFRTYSEHNTKYNYNTKYNCRTSMERMIPFDCIRLIVTFTRLKERFTWSLVHRDFAFQENDWYFWGKHFKLKYKTRDSVKELIGGHFDAQYLFGTQERNLWSFHLNKPLQLWSPWTLKKFCRKYTKGCSMSFRNFAFIDFINNITSNFGLKSTQLTCQSLVVKIWNKKIPMVYIYKRNTLKRVTKLHISSAFKSFDLARVFVSFRLHGNQLLLYPHRLEFLVS